LGCVVCGGGLAIPMMMRAQQQRAALEAERAALEARRAAEEQLQRTQQMAEEDRARQRQEEEQARPDPDRAPELNDSNERVAPEKRNKCIVRGWVMVIKSAAGDAVEDIWREGWMESMRKKSVGREARASLRQQPRDGPVPAAHLGRRLPAPI